MNKINYLIRQNSKKVGLSMIIGLFASFAFSQQRLSPDKEITYCIKRADKTLQAIPTNDKNLPRTIKNGSAEWKYVNYHDWCSGFWPGILWNLYETTHDKKWKVEANKFTQELMPIVNHSGFDHDLGFTIFNSFGNGYRLTKDPAYKL